MGGPSNPGPDPTPRAEPTGTPEHVVDAFFDRELDPAQARDLLAGLRQDPARSEEVARTQRMLSLLRRTPAHGEGAEEAMLDVIMARVERRRGFLPEVWRRAVTAGRLAVAATVLLAGLGIAVLGRAHPGALRLAPEPAPIASLVDAGRADAVESATRCTVVFEAISERASAPLRRQLRTSILCADVADSLGAPGETLSPGALATVRFASSGSELRVDPGSGEPQTGAMGASFGLGLEMVSSRQRSGASAPVLVPVLGSDRVFKAPGVRRAAPGSSAVYAVAGPSAAGPLAAGQAVKIGDHVLLVPAPATGPTSGSVNAAWAGSSDAPRRLLFIQASPSDQFPRR
jgi:hypothetical protein